MNPNHWPDIEQELTALFERQWYTNHGVLARRFEHELEQSLGVQHAVCVVNPAIGLAMALECFRGGALLLKPAQLQATAHNTGQACVLDATHLADWPDVQHHVHVLKQQRAQPDPPWLAVFSFENHHEVNAQGAACIATQCDHTAELLRNIRSSYGVRKPCEVVKTANGRMSEAQAAFGVVSLKWTQSSL
ncbi:MAG: DegT/DnrJ/EryC1/StrS family aminotransferase [Limnobacter sp.]|nr:DegT/DnrJ/EryC1/StrS family aminotransferase [Limnobacter sp.]